MNKQQLSKALADFERHEEDGVLGSEAASVLAAARLVERLLPGECEWCHGDGQLVRGNFNKGGEFYPCPHCQNGRVWDEGIVEALAKVICRFPGPGHNFECRDLARAALSALVELLTEKVEEPPKDPWDYDP